MPRITRKSSDLGVIFRFSIEIEKRLLKVMLGRTKLVMGRNVYRLRFHSLGRNPFPSSPAANGSFSLRPMSSHLTTSFIVG
jgi:hypothetical protein